MAQTQLHLVVGEFPGTIDLAFDSVDQVQLGGEFLFGIQRRREADRQRAGAIELHFRDIQHRQRAALVALGEHGRVFALGRLHLGGRGGCRFLSRRRFVRRG
ncbi:hypothetical protein D3C80_1308700 [compost metagenome]